MSVPPMQTTPVNPVQVTHKSGGGRKSQATKSNQSAQKPNVVTMQPRGAASGFAKAMASPLVQKTNSPDINHSEDGAAKDFGSQGIHKLTAKAHKPKK